METTLDPRPRMASERSPGVLRFLLAELRPKGPLLTTFNLISIPIIALGAVLIAYRFWYGLGAATNLSQSTPWGLWVGFDVVTGVAFAGGAYVLTFMVYVLRVEKYHPIIRVTVLNGFLAYAFYAGALLLDLGRPLHIVNPIIGNSFGVSSVLFLVAWHFALYMAAQLLEFSPTIAEWLGLRRARRLLGALTLGAVIFGITLSLLHQSGLGSLFLMARTKIHPLWWSEFIPLLFLVSSIFAGLSMVIIEGSISHRVFHDKLSPENLRSHDDILIGLSRICAAAMFVYLGMKLLALIHSHATGYLFTPMGHWYLVEVGLFTAVPMLMFYSGSKRRALGLIKAAAVMAIVGIVLNRLNVSVIAFKWYAPVHYVPSWMEIEITLAIVLAEIWALRWVILRMPVLSPPPSWARNLDAHPSTGK